MLVVRNLTTEPILKILAPIKNDISSYNINKFCTVNKRNQVIDAMVVNIYYN